MINSVIRTTQQIELKNQTETMAFKAPLELSTKEELKNPQMAQVWES